MTVDLAGLPWWAALLILLIGGAIAFTLSTAIWAVLLTLMFGKWWRALISLAVIGVGIWLGAHRWLWRAVDEGWGENGWLTAAVVVTVIGIPGALFALHSGAAGRITGGRGPSRSSGQRGIDLAAYNSPGNEWARTLAQRDQYVQRPQNFDD